jgi:hypothetical protein
MAIPFERLRCRRQLVGTGLSPEAVPPTQSMDYHSRTRDDLFLTERFNHFNQERGGFLYEK